MSRSSTIAVGLALLAAGASITWFGVMDLRTDGDPAPVAERPFLVGETERTSTGVALPAGGWLDHAVVPDAEPGARSPTDLTQLEADHLYIPALAVAAPVEDGRIIDGEMELPDQVGGIARYVDGAAVGDAQGTVLMAGHVNTRTQGNGVFAGLHAARVGMRVVLTGADGRPHDYVITGLTNVDKQALPSEIFTDTGSPRLVMVTCGGELLPLPAGGRTHANNVIATALPVRG